MRRFQKTSCAICILIGILTASTAQAQGLAETRDQLAEQGIEVGFGLTSIYQRNVNGGTSTHSGRGEFSGSYDVEILIDAERLLGIPGSLFFHAEGGWTDSEGIDGHSVGSYFGINADAIGNRSFDIVELFYELPLTDQLALTVGKIDFTGFFDASAYANDEASQFLNGALVNNPAVPFPDYSLGVILTYDLSDDWYLMAGAADAQADGRETGFNTAFHDEDYFFYIAETGLSTAMASANGDLFGTYRLGLWYDPQPKAYSDSSKEYRDDTGFYLSCDQMLTKENDDVEDTQGLGAFFRYGYAPSNKNDMPNFVSLGLQYQGLLNSRDDDVLGLGYAHGCFNNRSSSIYTEDYESVLEAYYSAQITSWMNVSPSVQYVTQPGGQGTGDAVVCGVRTQFNF